MFSGPTAKQHNFELRRISRDAENSRAKSRARGPRTTDDASVREGGPIAGQAIGDGTLRVRAHCRGAGFDIGGTAAVQEDRGGDAR
eukprot:5034261-Pyramimonas_sp.AAC.1